MDKKDVLFCPSTPYTPPLIFMSSIRPFLQAFLARLLCSQSLHVHTFDGYSSVLNGSLSRGSVVSFLLQSRASSFLWDGDSNPSFVRGCNALLPNSSSSTLFLGDGGLKGAWGNGRCMIEAKNPGHVVEFRGVRGIARDNV